MRSRSPFEGYRFSLFVDRQLRYEERVRPIRCRSEFQHLLNDFRTSPVVDQKHANNNADNRLTAQHRKKGRQVFFQHQNMKIRQIFRKGQL